MAACNELNFLFEIDLFFHHPRFENNSSCFFSPARRPDEFPLFLKLCKNDNFMALTLGAEKIPPSERSVIPAQELIDPNIQHFIAALPNSSTFPASFFYSAFKMLKQ